MGGISPVVLVFVDGLGLGKQDPGVNPVQRDVCPHLADFLADALPVDATLGVPGLPQSATGQTALLTGVNAAAAVGRHVEGFPTTALRRIIEENNGLRRLVEAGLPATFANGYFERDSSVVSRRHRQSVTTVAALNAFGRVRCSAELDRNEAVCHDLTRASLVARGYRGPLTTPHEAADHLMGIAAGHVLTLFEYFLTDRAGHAGNMAEAVEVLRSFDGFIGRLAERIDHEGGTLVLVSDHGNIEDVSVRTHTRNPVPLAVRPDEARAHFSGVRSLSDVMPALLRAARCLGYSLGQTA